jgi:serine/threonine protein kinase
MDEWHTWLSRFLSAPAAMAGYELLKYSDTGEVCRVRFEARGGSFDVVCKQSRPINIGRRIGAWIGRSRERRNFQWALRLMAGGIGTATPLAWLRRRGFSSPAWLVTEYRGDAAPLDRILLVEWPRLDSARRLMVKRHIILALAEFFTRLERAGFTHRDLKASNILLAHWDDDGRAEAMIVDLDGFRRCAAWMPPLRRWKPLLRLAASLREFSCVTRTDYARFLKAYVVQRPDRGPSWKDLFRRIEKRGFPRSEHRAQAR